MSKEFARTNRQGEFRYSRLVDQDDDESDVCESASSEDPYDSEYDRALDLEVEASPPERDNGSGGVVRDDANASFFSDYEAKTHSKASAGGPHSPLSPPPLLSRPGAVRANDAVAAHPQLHGDVNESHGPDNGDGFYDAEYASSMGRRGGTPSPSPTPEAVAGRGKDNAFAVSSQPGDHSNGWLDPLRSLSSPRADAESEKGLSRGSLYAPHGLSDSPRRGSHPSCSAPHSDTPVSNGGPPSVTLREGTAAPPQGFHTIPSRDTSTSNAYARASVRCVPEPAVTTRSLTPNGFTKSTMVPIGDAPIEAPAPPLQTQGDTPILRTLHSPDGKAVTIASPPPRKPEASLAQSSNAGSASKVLFAHIPGLHPLSTSVVTETFEAQQRVVRERAPRGVPLLRQCTGHASTPTRTVALHSAAAISGVYDSEEEEGTVNAGLHTSAYRDTSGMSDMITSSAPESPTASAKTKKKDVAHCTPERAGELRRRTRRSKSPFVSLVESGLPSRMEGSIAHPSQRVPSSSRSSPASCCVEGAALPELVDFSVHTDALGCSTQEDSLLLCAYSVESLPVVMEGSQGTRGGLQCSASSRAAQPHHPSPPPPTCKARDARPAWHTNNPSFVQFSRSENGSRQVSFDVPEGKERANFRAPQQQQQPVPIAREAEVDTFRHPWPSRELVYPTHTTDPIDVAAEAFHRKGPSRAFDVCNLIDSVEEAAVGKNSDQRNRSADLRLYNTVYGDRPKGVTQSDSVLTHNWPHTEEKSGFFFTTFDSALGHSCGQLQHRQRQREAVRQLLDTQTGPRRHSSSRLGSDNYDDMERKSLLATQERSSATYVARQEQLRTQHVAAEAERLRLGLALDVCQAVRPFGRDLLLMFLLLVEKSTTTQRRRLLRSHVWEGDCDRCDDRAQRGESCVSYDTCAEAINCVLERHGVGWVRATRELCRRVVAWCDRQSRNVPSVFTSPAMPLESTFVEYTTFVSCVMEFAAHYHNSMT